MVGRPETLVRMVLALERVVQRWVGRGVGVDEEEDCDGCSVLWESSERDELSVIRARAYAICVSGSLSISVLVSLLLTSDVENAPVRLEMYVSVVIELVWNARSRREVVNIAFVRWISDARGRRVSVLAGSEVSAGRMLDVRFVE